MTNGQKKYYAFHLKLVSLDSPGFNPGHYVIYMRKVLSFNRMELEFYFESSAAANDYKAWMDKMKEAKDKDECKGYAARKYEDDIVSRSLTEEEYFSVGRIQYADFVVEIVLKKTPHATEVFFVSESKPKLDVLYELIDLSTSALEMYGIASERGPRPTETNDEDMLSALQQTSQLIIVDAYNISRDI